MIGWMLLGGIAGALARYHGARVIQARVAGSFPLGTLLINLSGCWGLGLLTGLLASHPAWPADGWRLVLGVGFFGGYTTFSSFAWETAQLWRQGQRRAAGLNLAAQAGLGALLAAAGLLLGLHWPW
ncbi:fluoride efflux transporter CrcB [Kallotenue papyrolyticum]|uniref:fluoride efflux transporter CrcB n=1 Tax=Kallotenue papyrolyticum TaxID=1325125 RepID=UPI0004B87638|nr:fluoride efflux transporter CrcB [Kallotenue papyrolyticum]